MRKIISVLLMFLLLMNTLLLESGAKADVKDQRTLKECYMDILSKREYSEYYFTLGDLNEDLIPELMISSTDKCLDIVRYYTYQDGQAVEVKMLPETEGYNNYGDLYSMPERGTYAYYYQATAFSVEGSGIVIPRIIQEYKLTNNEISLVNTATWDEWCADTVTNEYRLNGSLCTADEFETIYEALGKRFDFISNTKENRKQYIADVGIADDSESETTPAPTESPVPTETPVPLFCEPIYRADHLTDPSEVEGATMENSFINADTPSQILVKGLQENGFAGTADAWRAVTRTCEAASDASKIVDYVMEEKDIYEALIFNILESVSKNNVKDALNTSMIKDASELFGVIKNDLKTKYMLDVTEDMKNSNLTPEMKERTKELAEEYFSKKGITKAADWLKGAADIMKALDTTESFCEEIAAYTSIRNMSDSMKTVLTEMKKKCPSDNRALSVALDDCIKVMEASDQEFEHQIMHGGIKVVGKEAAKTGISKFWKSIVAGKIKALCPEAAIVKAAYETSKYITNFMFNTDEITEKYYKMLASTELYSVLRDAYASLKDTYTVGKTVDCAEDYLSVVDVVFCTLRVDCECAYEYVDSLDSSNMNKLCGLFGCESDASALKDTIDSIERNYYSEYELVLTSWIFYLEEDFPSEYENYKHLADESVERIKEYRVHCPVDVYVYDSSGNLAASVVNDVPVSSGVTVLVDSDSKTFYLPEGESYTFTYIGNDVGTMDIEIAEYETDGSLLRTASFNALPLLSGTTYHSSENGRFLEAAEYQITDSENKKREIDFDSASPYGTQTCTISVEQGMILRNGLSDWTVKAGKNEILDLSAYIPEGYEFDMWQVLSGDIEIRDISNAETKVVVGDKDAAIKAVIKEKKEGGSMPLPVVSQAPVATRKPTGFPAILPNRNGNQTGVISREEPTGNVGAGAGKSVTVLGKPVIKSVKNTKGRTVKITIGKKVQGALGYQVQYALNKKFTKAKKSKDMGKWSSVKTITGLMKGKTYYVHVRAYKKSSGKKLYGKWSKVKKVKITK